VESVCGSSGKGDHAVARNYCVSVLLFILALAAGSAEAQISTGTPPFNSIQNGGQDAVNLGNLNVHLTVPVFSKAGRGLNFNFQLGFDTSVWQSSNYVGQYSWGPTSAIFLETVSPSRALTGQVGHNTVQLQRCPKGARYNAFSFTYIDPGNTPHPFLGNIIYVTGTGCGSTGSGFTALASDGSGYTITVKSDLSSVVYSKDGMQITPGAGLVDRNGNEVTVVGFTGGGFLDTTSTSSTDYVLSYQDPNLNTTVYTYTAPSGAQASFTVNYSNYTVQTNFGCPNVINEYPPTSIPLVSQIVLPDNSTYAFTYEPTPGYPTSVTGRLASVKFPTGGTIAYSYTGPNDGINCADGSTTGLRRTTPDTGSGYWSYTQTPGTSGASTTTVVDPAGNYTVIQFQNYTEISRSTYHGSVSASNLLETETSCYTTSTPPSCLTSKITPPISLYKNVQLAGSGNLVSQKVLNFDQYGNILTESDYDFGAGAPGSLLKKTSITYATLTNITSFPQQVTVTNGSGALLSQTAYNYGDTVTATSGTPQHTTPPGSRGNLLSVNQWINSANYLTKSYTYYDTGNIQTATDVNGAQTTYTYGACGNSFPTSISEPVSMSRSLIWNCAGAVVTTIKDENGNTTNINYTDPDFWRPASIGYPDGGSTNWTYNSPTSSTTQGAINATQTGTGTTILDGLGRTKQQQVSVSSQNVIYTDTTYDSLGRIYTVSNPYLTKSDPTYGVTTYQYDGLSRPTLAIPPDGSPSANNISITYANNCSTTADQAGKKRTLCVNSLGYLTKVFEDPSGLKYETDYTTDSLGNILTVSQMGGSSNSANWHTRTYTYDFLSRLTKSVVPESGTIIYSYDTNGNGDLASKTSPAPNQTGAQTVTTSYCYDALHRVTAKAYTTSPNATPTCSGTPPTFPSPGATFTYDVTSIDGLTIANPVGHLVKAATTGTYRAASYYTYDTMGRIQNQSSCVYINNCGTTSPTLWVVHNTYDLAGDLHTYMDPSGTLFTQTFDNVGRPISLTSAWVDFNHPATLVSVASTGYTAFALQQALLGNGLTQAIAYNTRLQPCAIDWNASGSGLGGSCTATPANDILHLAYNFNLNTSNNGNVTGWTSTGQQTFNRSYTFDTLNRLTGYSDTASSQACKGLSWSIDAWGNRWQQTQTSGTCAFTFNQPVNTKNQFSASNYDAAGNLLGDGTHAYSYDAEDRIQSVDSGKTASYVYDANGLRVAKMLGSIGFYYVYNSNGQPLTQFNSIGQWNFTNIYFGGSLVGFYSGSTTGFFHRDHLGSNRLVTLYRSGTPSYSVYDYMDYLPYGEQLAGGSATAYKFTSYERDGTSATESGLDYAGARHYSSSLGRFMQPDPSGAAFVDTSNPQSLNLYSYALNNPLKYTDPSGLYCYYGNTSDGSVDWNDSSQYDFSSNPKECEATNGQWYGLETDIQTDFVTDTPMDAPNSVLQSISDFVDAWKAGPSSQQLRIRLNQCAAANTNKAYSKVLGNNKAVNAVGGNAFAALSQLVYGPTAADRKEGAIGTAVAGPTPYPANGVAIGVQAGGQAIGNIPVSYGTLIAPVAGSEINLGGRQAFATMISKYVATRVKDLAAFGKATGVAADVLDGKLVFDGITYLVNEAGCALP
jgi:RHS repeat-associated protein